jgi:hypothetical protein
MPRLHKRLAIPVASHRFERGEGTILLARRQPKDGNSVGAVAKQFLN